MNPWLELCGVLFFAMTAYPWVLICCCDSCGPCCGGPSALGGCVPNILYSSFEESPDSDQPCICPNGAQFYETVWDHWEYPGKWSYPGSFTGSDQCLLGEIQLTIVLWCAIDEETGDPMWYCQMQHNFGAVIDGVQVGEVSCDPFQIVFDFELTDSVFCPTAANGMPAKIRMTITA